MAYDIIGSTRLYYDDIIEDKYEELIALLRHHGYTSDSFEKLELDAEVTGNPVPEYNGGHWEPSERARIEDMTVEVADESKETLAKVKELKEQYDSITRLGNDLKTDLKKAQLILIRKIEKLRWIDITDYLTGFCLEKIEKDIIQGDYCGGDL